MIAILALLQLIALLFLIFGQLGYKKNTEKQSKWLIKNIKILNENIIKAAQHTHSTTCSHHPMHPHRQPAAGLSSSPDDLRQLLKTDER